MKGKRDPLALFLLAILEAGILICAVPAFVSVNLPNSPATNFRNSIFISICFTIVCLVFYFTAKKRQWWGILGLIFSIMVELLTLIMIFPNQSGRSWSTDFFSELGREIRNFSHFNFVVMPEILATILVFILITIFLLVGIYYYQWYIIFPLALTYLLSVTVFDSHEHLVEGILILLFFAIQLFLVSNYDEIFIKKNHVLNPIILGLISLILAVGAGIFFRNTFINLAQVIDSPGVKVRNRLNTLGFYQTINDQSQNKPDAKKAGFSINSRELGGPILDNDKLVYTVWEKTPNYLRIDTKSNYSGRGFNDHETLGSDVFGSSVLKDDLHLPVLEPKSSVKIIYSSNIKYSDPQFIPQVYGKMEIDLRSQKIKTATNNDLNSILQFNNSNDTKNQIVYNVNYYDLSLNNLKKSSLTKIPASIIQTGTQLPRKVPSRVKKLAEEITNDKTTYLDKVTAVEHYLKNKKKFTYSRLDAHSTPAGRDFVDYFLFEHPIGYCDNFSVSMVVLLRSIGIPARYAEGFSEGSYKQKIGDNYEYEIRNNNAHSWPEVYFSGIGWVPFEPTPGFKKSKMSSNESNRSEQMTAKEEKMTSSNSGSSASSSSKTNSSKKSSSKESKKKSNSNHHKSKNKTKKHSILVPVILSIIALALIILIFIYRQSLYWISLNLLFYGDRQPEKFYLLTLHYFEERLKREKKESLSHYAERLVILYPQIKDVYLKATKEYETRIYFKDHLNDDLSETLHQLSRTMTRNPKTVKVIK